MILTRSKLSAGGHLERLRYVAKQPIPPNIVLLQVSYHILSNVFVILVIQVVKMKGTGKVYALKILNKVEMLKRHQVQCTVPIKECVCE